MEGSVKAPSNYDRFHHPDCGTKYRGCSPECPKDIYEKMGVWYGPINDHEYRIGDKVTVEGDSSFCGIPFPVTIDDIKVKYNEDTGKPYYVIVCGSSHYRESDGACIKGADAYYLSGKWVDVVFVDPGPDATVEDLL